MNTQYDFASLPPTKRTPQRVTQLHSQKVAESRSSPLTGTPALSCSSSLTDLGHPCDRLVSDEYSNSPDWLQTLHQSPTVCAQMCAHLFRKFDVHGVGSISILDAHSASVELCKLLSLESPSEISLRRWHQNASTQNLSGMVDDLEVLTEDEFTSYFQLHLRLAIGAPLVFDVAPDPRSSPRKQAKEESASMASTSATASCQSLPSTAATASSLAESLSLPSTASCSRLPDDICQESTVIQEKPREDGCSDQETMGFGGVGGATVVLLLFCLI